MLRFLASTVLEKAKHLMLLHSLYLIYQAHLILQFELMLLQSQTPVLFQQLCLGHNLQVKVLQYWVTNSIRKFMEQVHLSKLFMMDLKEQICFLTH